MSAKNNKRGTEGSSQKCDDRYAGERYSSALAHCLPLKLYFDGKRFKMTGGSETYTYPAVSGRPSKDGKFNYSKANQSSSNSGPIPEGKYWINPDELWTRSWLKKLLLPDEHQQGWGNYRITIHPFTTTVTRCRGGFFIHGGAFLGSAGCIDLTLHMPKFVNDLKKEGAIRKCQIHLTVDYSSSDQ